MAHTHASCARAMALAPPCGELGHIWPKQHKCVARSRPFLGAHARPCVCTMAVARPRRCTWCSRINHRKICTPSVRRNSSMNRGIVHQRIVRVDGDEGPAFSNRIQGLGWRFMYDDLVRINLSMVREFCANFSSATQNHVYLRGKKIPFTEAHIHSYLGIPGDAPDADVDDAFIALAKAYKRGEDVNMGAIYAEIGRP
ncbi:hypothetical protein PIB30_022129 [Stylosanthes scabra]|uniref:Uncharacterized protein n=1 Tax=Stylosanthes scabra TaxID=79078 RepID=A0ABU6T8S6_9FABA|nr:hypothetical protein [Stylosanthes scabra]